MKSVYKISFLGNYTGHTALNFSSGSVFDSPPVEPPVTLFVRGFLALGESSVLPPSFVAVVEGIGLGETGLTTSSVDAVVYERFRSN